LSKQKPQVVADEELIEKAKALEEARRYAHQWSERAEYYRDEILEKMDQQEALQAVTASGVKVVSVVEVPTKRFNRKRFEADHPEIDLSEYDEPSLSRQVRPARIL
jgi:hypothetical protein